MEPPEEPYGLFLKKKTNPRVWPWAVWLLFGIFGFPAFIGEGEPVIKAFWPIWFYGLAYFAIAWARFTKDPQSRLKGFAIQLSVDQSWFRIHFLTAIVLMVSASIMVGVLCSIMRNDNNWKFDEAPPDLETLWHNYQALQGWDKIIALVGMVADLLIPVVFVVEQLIRELDAKK